MIKKLFRRKKQEQQPAQVQDEKVEQAPLKINRKVKGKISMPKTRERFTLFGHIYYCAGYMEDKNGYLSMLVRRRVEARSESLYFVWPLMVKKEQVEDDTDK